MATRLVRLGVTIAGLIALTVALAAWSSSRVSEPRGVSASRAASAKSSLIPTTTGKFTSADCAKDRAAGTITYVSPFGISAGIGIGAALDAEYLGLYKKLCLTVALNTTSFSYTELLQADKAQVSTTTSAANVMSDDSGGINNIVGVMTPAKVNPTSIVMNSKFKSLKGLEGQTFGYYTSMTASYVAMFVKEHVPFNNIHVVSLTNRSATIIENEVAGFSAFLGSQDLELQSDGVPYTEISAQKLGIPGTTQIMMMNKTFVKDYPVAAENFIRANLETLHYCAAHMAQCISLIVRAAAAANDTTDTLAFETLTADYQYKTFLEAKGAATSPVGTFAAATWTPEYQQTKKYAGEANVLSGLPRNSTNLPSLKTMINTKLVASVYNSSGQLIWP